MKIHTYRDLLNALQCLSPERLDDNVAIELDDCGDVETYGFSPTGSHLVAKTATDTNGVLDADHFYLEVTL